MVLVTDSMLKHEDFIHLGLAESGPSYPGGEEKFITYIKDSIKPPPNFIIPQGKIYVNFIIERNGHLSNTKISRSLGYEWLDKEILRLVTKSKWKPGRIRNIPVRLENTIAIPFYNTN